MEAFGRSLESDRRLAPYDLLACKAHLTMLEEVGALDSAVVNEVLVAIATLEQRLQEGLVPEGEDEDIHSWVERELKLLVGEKASSIRLGRSRNDLVATDFRLWMKDQVRLQQQHLRQLQEALLRRAEENPNTLLPGYTHLQRAQPVTLAHHLMAHFWSFQRDFERFERVYEEADCCILGAGALAGSSWQIRPERTAELLGFSRHFQNSLDAVSDRDFAVEFLAAASICAIHLSRLAEEIILWTSGEFQFAEMDDAWATGSSLMPQKKNPDPAELIRGRCGGIVGRLSGMLVTLKALPLAYNRDLQEDKPPVFEAADTLASCVEVAAHVMATLQFRASDMETALADPGLLATDLADALVREGLPFSEAHEVAGKWVAGRLSPEQQELVSKLEGGLTPQAVIEARTHPGAPGSVSAQLVQAKALISGG